MIRNKIVTAVCAAGMLGALVVGLRLLETDPELELVAVERSQRRRDSDVRQRRRTAAKWLHSHGQPRASRHPFVWRLFAEMGDHPLNRDYYAIAHRRLARWFSELPSVDESIDRVAKSILPARPDEGDAVALDEWLTNYEACKEMLILELREDAMAFAERYCGLEWLVVRPPPEVVYRYSCQIIEGAIRMRVEDLEVSQNVLRSKEVRTAGTDQLSWRQQFALWRGGVIGFPEIFSKPPSVPSGTP